MDKMKAGLDEQYDRIKLDIIKRKQDLESQTAELLKRLNEEGDKERTQLAETLQKVIKSASKDKKKEEYIEYKQSK
jgi:hypothetical protein